MTEQNKLVVSECGDFRVVFDGFFSKKFHVEQKNQDEGGDVWISEYDPFDTFEQADKAMTRAYEASQPREARPDRKRYAVIVFDGNRNSDKEMSYEGEVTSVENYRYGDKKARVSRKIGNRTRNDVISDYKLFESTDENRALIKEYTEREAEMTRLAGKQYAIKERLKKCDIKVVEEFVKPVYPDEKVA